MRATSCFSGERSSTSPRTCLQAPARSCGAHSAGALLAFLTWRAGFRIKHLLRASVTMQQAVDYELLQALIATESGFDAAPCRPKARSA
jgi:hypothetical protein